MGAKAIVAERIALTPMFDTDDDRNGFVVQGTKAGVVTFLVSGIRRITVTLEGSTRGRARILWLRPRGMEIREEILAVSVVEAKRSVALMVNFDTLTSVIVQGEPMLTNNTFQGQMVKVHWSSDLVELLSQATKQHFSCVPNQRAKQITMSLQRSTKVH